MKKNIAVIGGGDSAEDVISFQSANTISEALDPSRFNVFKILMKGLSWMLKHPEGDIPVDKNDFSCLVNGQKIRFDCGFIAIHGTPGEDGKLQGYLDMMNVPYTTPDAFTSALTFNKYACNNLLRQFGVLSAKSTLIAKREKYNAQNILEEFSLPFFVKPNNGGSSLGVSKVKTAGDLDEAVQNAFEHDDKVIVEEFIEGSELTCGIAKHHNELLVLPLTEIVSKNDFFDYQAKYEGASEEITPARVSKEIAKRCKEISTFIFKKLNCKGIVRIDFINRGGELYLLEINTVPGMSKASIVPQQVAAIGMTLRELFSVVVDDALRK